jgi:hypothetical protein
LIHRCAQREVPVRARRLAVDCLLLKVPLKNLFTTEAQSTQRKNIIVIYHDILI